MSTPWVPTKPRALPWKIAARIGDDFYIADGFCMVIVAAPSNPYDSKTLAKVVGDGPAVTLLQTGAWERDRPDRAAEDVQNALRQVWQGSEATPGKRMTVAPTHWCQWMDTRGEPILVRLFKSGDTVISINHEYLNPFISTKHPFDTLAFHQREDAPGSAVQVWTGSTPRGLIMPMVSMPDLLDGISDLLGAAV